MFSSSALATPLGPAAIDPPRLARPRGGALVCLGFPSPAEDYIDDSIDLNQWLIRNPAATFYYRAAGDSMVKAGIFDGDLLAVDRSVTARDGDLVLAIYDGNQPTCKILRIYRDRIELHSASDDYAPIVLRVGCDGVELFAITGIARQIVRRPSRVRPR